MNDLHRRLVDQVHAKLRETLRQYLSESNTEENKRHIASHLRSTLTALLKRERGAIENVSFEVVDGKYPDQAIINPKNLFTAVLLQGYLPKPYLIDIAELNGGTYDDTEVPVKIYFNEVGWGIMER